MSINILMPALSPTMTEGKLAKWHVKVGDTVKAGQVICEIETDKATMEVEAVDEGKVGQIVVPEGTEAVKVNADIAVLLEEGEKPGAAAPSVAQPAAADLGESPVAVLGAFSWSLLVTAALSPRVGKWIDARGGRPALLSSIAVVAAGQALLAWAPGLAASYLAWTVVGIGMSIAMCCDLVIASETTRFAQIFRRIGLAPDGGAIWLLNHRLGMAKAKELVFTGRFVEAAEALQLGLVNEVVPDDQLMDRAEALARESGARIGGTLYADTLSDPGGSAPGYIEMMRANTAAIAAALR